MAPNLDLLPYLGDFPYPIECGDGAANDAHMYIYVYGSLYKCIEKRNTPSFVSDRLTACDACCDALKREGIYTTTYEGELVLVFVWKANAAYYGNACYPRVDDLATVIARANARSTSI